MFLAANIKAIRAKWSENQKVFSGRFEMTPGNLSRLELGVIEMNLKSLLKLSELSGISIDRLVKEQLSRADIPEPKISGGVDKVAGTVPSVIPHPQLGDLHDFRALVDKVRELDVKFRELDENALRKMDLMGLVVQLIDRLEAGLDEGDYKAEKKAFIGRLAALLDGAEEK